MAAAQHRVPALMRLGRSLAPAAGVLLVVLAWEIACLAFQVPTYLVPRPSQILARLGPQAPSLFRHLRTTASEALGGFATGTAFSIALGLLIVYVPAAKRFVMPHLVLLKSAPKVAIAPLFVIWFGFGIHTNIIYTALVCFFPVLVNFIAGLEDVRESERRLMASWGASRWQMFRQVHLYRALPYLFAGLKMSAVLAVIGAVVSEFVAGDSGLGYYMVQMQGRLRMVETFSGLVILTLFSLTLYQLVEALQRAVTPWNRSSDRSDLGLN